MNEASRSCRVHHLEGILQNKTSIKSQSPGPGAGLECVEFKDVDDWAILPVAARLIS